MTRLFTLVLSALVSIVVVGGTIGVYFQWWDGFPVFVGSILTWGLLLAYLTFKFNQSEAEQSKPSPYATKVNPSSYFDATTYDVTRDTFSPSSSDCPCDSGRGGCNDL